ncbi:MAG TPA: hypothetical protein PKL13_01025, partial [bacterium]|nr:hypothetical protein [bacterium]
MENKKIKIKKSFLIINVFLFLFLLITKLYATDEIKYDDPLQGKTIPELIGTIIFTLLGIVGSLSL